MAMTKALGAIDEYVDDLDDDLRFIAKEQLREDAEIRAYSLQAFRDWILKNPDILKCRLDSSFLLRFLRVKKYSMPLAQEILMRYITTRLIIDDLFTKLDCLEPSIKRIFDTGTMYVLKGRNDDGRRVMHTRYSLIDPAIVHPLTLIRAFIIALETLNQNNDTQIAGVTYIADFTDAGLNLVSMWNPTLIQKMISGVFKSYAIRHKEIHCISVPGAFVSFVKLFMKFTGDKMQKRFVVHDVGVKLEDLVPQRMLPKECGGSEYTRQEIIDSWKEELLECRDTLLQLDELAVSESCKSKRTKEISPDNDLGCDGSFRQLQID